MGPLLNAGTVQGVTRLGAAIASALAVYVLTCLWGRPHAGPAGLERLTAKDPRAGDGREAGPGGRTGAGGQPGWVTVVRRWVPSGFRRAAATWWPPQAEAAAALSGRGFGPLDAQLAGALVALGGGLGLIASGLAGRLAGAWVPAAVVAAGVAVPRLWLKSVVQAHQAAVGRDLPKVAEILTLGAESGLDLLGATRLAVGLSAGPVGKALGEALSEIDAGRDTAEALKGLAARAGGPETAAFVGTLLQGLALGTPVARVLRSLVETLRSKRRQSLEARIAGLSLKLTLVTVLLFVPGLMVLAILPNLLAFLRGW